MNRISDRLARYKHNRGFGIQSPFAYHLATQVLRERLPYYSYSFINNIANEVGDYKPSHCCMLFRLVNYQQPENLIVLSPEGGSVACALRAAKPNIPSYLLFRERNFSALATDYLSQTHCRLIEGNELRNLKELLAHLGKIGLLHVGRTPHYAAVLELALPYANENTMILIEDIHSTPQRFEWWSNLIADERIGVTFDLYSTGILFFNPRIYKQHYILKC